MIIFLGMYYNEVIPSVGIQSVNNIITCKCVNVFNIIFILIIIVVLMRLPY